MPEPINLQPVELLQIAADFFESHQIPYRVVGSMASIAYGENRFTNDVDMVADVQLRHVDALCESFTPPDYYVARQAIEDAIANRFQFNIIHILAGLKIDVMIPQTTEFAKIEQQRSRRLTDSEGLSALFASPEDVILNKLMFFQKGKSEKHLRDIAGILRVKGTEIDHDYIHKWASELKVLEEWQMIVKKLNERNP